MEKGNTEQRNHWAKRIPMSFHVLNSFRFHLQTLSLSYKISSGSISSNFRRRPTENFWSKHAASSEQTVEKIQFGEKSGKKWIMENILGIHSKPSTWDGCLIFAIAIHSLGDIDSVFIISIMCRNKWVPGFWWLYVSGIWRQFFFQILKISKNQKHRFIHRNEISEHELSRHEMLEHDELSSIKKRCVGIVPIGVD